MNKTINGFTLMELMIVLVIIGILAVFALPQYNRTLKIDRVKRAKNQLQALHTAQKFYRARNNSTYYPETGTVSNVEDINRNLAVNVSSDFTYSLTPDSIQVSITPSLNLRIDPAETFSKTKITCAGPDCTYFENYVDF